MAFAEQAQQQPSLIADYYQRQSIVYDATRWSFLFGRKMAIHQLPLDEAAAFNLLEVGCGTGTILKQAALRYPKVQLHGLDCSEAMLQKAQQKLTPFQSRLNLHNLTWDSREVPNNWTFDVIVMAYTLTMVNPHWQAAVDLALRHLKPGGYLSVVDFHDTPLPFYKRFMRWHHVSLDGHLLPYLEQQTTNPRYQLRSGLFRGWRYLVFRGQRPLSQ